MRDLVATAFVLVLAGCGEAQPSATTAQRPAAGTTAPPAFTPDVDHPAPDVTAPRPRPARTADTAPAARRPWIDVRGTSIVGFGLLRIVPDRSASAESPATVRVRYRETPDGYATTGNLQLFVLPSDAFARTDRAYADSFLAFGRTADEAAVDDDGALQVEASFDVALAPGRAESTVIVAYGPWTAPDAGRPAGDVPTFSLDVEASNAAWEWIESEAGELITTNWTNRPDVARGRPVTDPETFEDVWLEVRPMILYDARLARAATEPPSPTPPGAADAESIRAEAARREAAGDEALAADARERAADLAARESRADGRLVLTPALAEKFRRVPIRWR